MTTLCQSSKADENLAGSLASESSSRNVSAERLL